MSQDEIINGNANNLWQQLWEYDPNGLVVFDKALNIQVTNPAFIGIFGLEEDSCTGKKLDQIFSSVEDFNQIIHSQKDRIILERHYPEFNRFVREVLFHVKTEDLYACIIVDQTENWQRENEFRKIQNEAVKRLNELTTKQMMAAQSIASLLGETTAETKVNVLKLQHLLETDRDDHEFH